MMQNANTLRKMAFKSVKKESRNSKVRFRFHKIETRTHLSLPTNVSLLIKISLYLFICLLSGYEPVNPYPFGKNLYYQCLRLFACFNLRQFKRNLIKTRNKYCVNKQYEMTYNYNTINNNTINKLCTNSMRTVNHTFSWHFIKIK